MERLGTDYIWVVSCFGVIAGDMCREEEGHKLDFFFSIRLKNVNQNHVLLPQVF